MTSKQQLHQVDMAFWGVPYQPATDDEHEHEHEPSAAGFFWHDGLATPGGDVHPGDGDLFGQFVDFDDPHPSSVSGGGGGGGFMGMSMGMGMSMTAITAPSSRPAPGQEDPFLIDQPSDSLGSSTADDLDFLSSSTEVDAAPSSAYDFDSRALESSSNGTIGTAAQQHQHQQHQESHLNHHHHHQHHHQQQQQQQQQQQRTFTKGCGVPVSESDLPCVEGISLSSPTKLTFSSTKDSFTSSTTHQHQQQEQPQEQQRHPPSPTPPKNRSIAGRRASRLVEAVGATIRKATAAGTRKKQRKPLPPAPARPGSPVFDEEDHQIVAPRQRPRERNDGSSNASEHQEAEGDNYQVNGATAARSSGADFVLGPCDDPYRDAPPLPLPLSLRYDDHSGISSPLVSPGIKSEASATEGIWPQPGPWNTAPITSDTPPWWGLNSGSGTPVQDAVPDVNMMNMPPVHPDAVQYHHHHQHHHQQGFHQTYQDASATGLMIHIPPSHPSTDDANPSPRTRILPPNLALPPPQTNHASDRTNRPPKAPSSGARRLSHSPVRRTRARSRSRVASGSCSGSGSGTGSVSGPTSATTSASASPTRSASQGQIITQRQGHTRQNSNSSISSSRSVSAGGGGGGGGGTRLPASMPGTPCSVRKRRSREPSGSGPPSATLGGEIGFVNFTPNDGGMLMTGVAPSGSSKTKARREKEAAERRRKMNEAAIRAVAAAGGDVDRLMQQGFAF